LELTHRLPRIWARVEEGTLAPWRARRIAEETLCLSSEAAAFVDQVLAPFAHRTGLAQTQRTVDQAIARFMPEFARERRERAADQRHFDIDHDQVSFAGTTRVHGELDLADALDLEDAIRAGAAHLKDLGSEDSLDVRRAAALGDLARGQQPLDLGTGSGGEEVVQQPSRDPGRRREVVLYVHLAEDAIRSGDRDAPVHLENAGGQLLTAGQVADWCRLPETGKVTVKPVIDLHRAAGVDSYRVPPWLAEAVQLRDRTCVFPYCHRPVRGCDIDHVVPHSRGGPTTLANLACLCRLHHRLKTHAHWTYYMLLPGIYVWHSPHGHTWLRDRTGTDDLTPPKVEPPRRRTS
jgi:5-methylcytosine-specific restriction endonuclease McrA